MIEQFFYVYVGAMVGAAVLAAWVLTRMFWRDTRPQETRKDRTKRFLRKR